MRTQSSNPQFTIFVKFSDDSELVVESDKTIDFSANEIVRFLRRYADDIEKAERQIVAGLRIVDSLRQQRPVA